MPQYPASRQIKICSASALQMISTMATHYGAYFPSLNNSFILA